MALFCGFCNYKTKIKRAAKCVVMVASFFLVACAGNTNNEVDGINKANNTTEDISTLRIATEAAYPPFNDLNASGVPIGFDVDIANALCVQMGVHCQIIPQDWEGIIPALKQDKFDMIVSAMSVTSERAEQVDFSEPYFANTLVFLASKSSDFDPANPDDINATKISAQRSTISSQYFIKTYPNATIQLHDTLNNAFLDLSSARTGAMIADKVPASAWLNDNKNQDFEIKGQEININDNIAVAVNKGNTALLQKINDALAALKQNGEYDKLVAKHFGT